MITLSVQDVRHVLKAKVDALGSVRAASRVLGVSETAIRAVMNSGSDPGEKLARALGFKRAAGFVPLRKGEVA
jgi:biotin operon repressor